MPMDFLQFAADQRQLRFDRLRCHRRLLFTIQIPFGPGQQLFGPQSLKYYCMRPRVGYLSWSQTTALVTKNQNFSTLCCDPLTQIKLNRIVDGTASSSCTTIEVSAR